MSAVQIGASFDGGGQYAQYLTTQADGSLTLTGVVDEGRVSEERFTHPLESLTIVAPRPEWFADSDLGLVGDVASWNVDAATAEPRSLGVLAVRNPDGFTYSLYTVGEAL